MSVFEDCGALKQMDMLLVEATMSSLFCLLSEYGSNLKKKKIKRKNSLPL